MHSVETVIYEDVLGCAKTLPLVVYEIFILCIAEVHSVVLTEAECGRSVQFNLWHNKRIVFYKSDKIKGPISLASDSLGNIYVSNYSANNVLKITPQGVATILVDKLDKPYGLHVQGDMLFITCQGSNSVFRQKISR